MEQELMHYGVLGMKWGVRKNPKRMSDEELNTRLKRLSAEQQYADAMDKKHPVQKIVKDLAKQSARDAASKLIGKGLDRLLEKRFNVKDYDFKDVSKVSSEKLQAANKWLAQANLYTKTIKDLMDEYDGPSEKDISNALFGEERLN